MTDDVTNRRPDLKYIHRFSEVPPISHLDGVRLQPSLLNMPLPKTFEASSLSCENKVVAHRYMVVKRIGSGSFGTVFLVTDSKAGNDKFVSFHTHNV